MKKIISIIGFVLVAGLLSFAFFQANQAEADPELSIGKVKEQLSSQYPGEITTVELDSNDGNYQVVMETETKAYQLKVDGDTSKIMEMKEIEKKKEQAATNPSAPAKKKTSDNKKQKEKKQAIISRETAMEKALAEFSGTVEEVELDEDNGKLRYEVEVVNGEMEAEIEVDAYTGKVIMIEIDD